MGTKVRKQGSKGQRALSDGVHATIKAGILLLGLVTTAGFYSLSTPRAQTSHTYYFPIAHQNYQLTGEVAGRVLNAADGVTPIPNAQVCLGESTECVTTDAMGTYSFPGIPVGAATLTAASFGFFDQIESVTIAYHQTASQDFYLIPSTTDGVVQVTLTWDSRRDLDTHLWLPPSTPVHIYWRFLGDCGLFPYACLDKDDYASGPETLRIRQQLPGNYVYAVFLFNPGNIANSAPQVRITDAHGFIAEIEAPADGQGRWWHVFDLDGFTGNINLINQVTFDNPAPYDPSTGFGEEVYPEVNFGKR